MGGEMKKPVWLTLLAAAAFAGRNLAGALHELGHAAVALLLGGTVEHVQSWHFIGTPLTYVSGLTDTQRAVMDISGMLLSNALGVAALLVVPWAKLSARWATTLAVFLCFFIIQTGPLALQSLNGSPNNDGSNFVRHCGCSPWVAVLVGATAFGGSSWLWFRRTRFWDRLSDAWR
jgi:hypothetical protein